MDEASRPCRSLFPLLTAECGAYDEAALGDERVRQVSIAQHPEYPTRTWLRAMTLIGHAFRPDMAYTCGETELGTGSRACGLRLELLTLAGRSSKPALDLTLAGYYTEAWAVLRSMLEGWARAVYIRLRPEAYDRWYAEKPEDASPRETRKRFLRWRDCKEAIDGSQDDGLIALFADADLRWKVLNKGVHPSGEGITQVWNDARDLLTLRQAYREDFAMATFSHAAFIHMVLLREIRELGSGSTGWLEDVDDFIRAMEIENGRERPILRGAAQD